MSTKQFKDFISSVFSPVSHLGRKFRRFLKRISRAVRRELLSIARRAKRSGAGFVLPTVTMVMLVVVLLTLSIAFRSFERVNQARNVRINQALLSASTPALDRARAKIGHLLNDNTAIISKGTPTEKDISKVLETSAYKLPDEDVLQVGFDLNKNGSLNPLGVATNADDDNNLGDNEVIKTAWRFPIDTDNNGKFDSYSVYGVFFRNPTPNATTGTVDRERSPLEARSLPVPKIPDTTNPMCKALSNAILGGDSGWYYLNGDLKKSFFVYAVNSPVVQGDPNLSKTNYELSKAGNATTALEYQQDWTRKSLMGVVYEDDLGINPGPQMRLNGKVTATSNLFLSAFADRNIILYPLSGKESCFYSDENGKITVGGNLIIGQFGGSERRSSLIHLFQPKTAITSEANDSSSFVQELTTTNQSVSTPTTGTVPTGGSATGNMLAAYAMNNDRAYAARIQTLITKKDGASNVSPEEVVSGVASGLKVEKAWEGYFKARTRKVPFTEIGLGTDGLPLQEIATTLDAASFQSIPATSSYKDELVPPDTWMYPTTTDASKLTATTTGNGTNLTIVPAQLPATNPTILDKIENFLGDRILVGNNLPALRWGLPAKTAPEIERQFLGGSVPQEVNGTTTWNQGGGIKTRATQVTSLPQLSDIGRGGIWEKDAANEPANPLSGVGGLRVITGAGVYERLNSFLPPPYWDDPRTLNIVEKSPTYDNPNTSTVEAFPIVWPDTMPMSPPPGATVYNNSTNAWEPLPTTYPVAVSGSIDPNTPQFVKGDLRMRATAVYHYASGPSAITEEDVTIGNETVPTKVFNQNPIACVSSYYDPSDRYSSRNPLGLADVSGEIVGTQPAAIGTSTTTNTLELGRSNNGIVYGPPGARPTGTISSGELFEQANLVFPDGTPVNPLLKSAIAKADADRTLGEKSAIDSTMCALGILGTSGFSVGSKPAYIPDGAIEEISMLDARQVKQIDVDPNSAPPNLPIAADADPTNPVMTGKYDMPLEERQPMEVRLTRIDLGVLRNQVVPVSGTRDNIPQPEYMLPNSGLIYASREDALHDMSATNNPFDVDLISPTDFKLDPRRRPHGILLENGIRLGRNDANNDGQNDTFSSGNKPAFEDVAKEKGLILVSNVPVYVKATLDGSRRGFNLHTQEEFDQPLNKNDFSNFYLRSGGSLNRNFACRAFDDRLPGCTTGDAWRPATVISDAVTLLSDNFRFGFRNEGDFDLGDNTGNNKLVVFDDGDDALDIEGARMQNGLFRNAFAINGLSSRRNENNATSSLFNLNNVSTLPLEDSDYRNSNNAQINRALYSSYFTNFVTPIQRRVNFPEYVMEICRKLPVSSCQADDWVVGTTTSPNALTEDVIGQDATNLLAGTTALPAKNKADQRFPRRIAFMRDSEMAALFGYPVLKYDPNHRAPIPLGINDAGKVQEYPYNPTKRTTSIDGVSTELPRLQPNALWYWTTRSVDGKPFDELGNTSLESDQPLYYYPRSKNISFEPGLPNLLPDIAWKDGLTDLTFCSPNDGFTTNFDVNQQPEQGGNNEFRGINCMNDVKEVIRKVKDFPSDGSTTDGNSNIVIDLKNSTPSTTDNYTVGADGRFVFDLDTATLAAGGDSCSATNQITKLTIYAPAKTPIILRRDGALTIGKDHGCLPDTASRELASAMQNNEVLNFNSASFAENNTFRVELKGGVGSSDVVWSIDGHLNIVNAPEETSKRHLIIGTIFGTQSTGSGFSQLVDLYVGANTYIWGRVLGYNGSQKTFPRECPAAAGPFGPQKREWLIAQSNNAGGNNDNAGGGNDNAGGGNDNTGGGNDNTGGGNDNTGGGNDNTGGGNTTTGPRCLAPNTRVVALTTTYQPQTVPALQIYLPTSTDTNIPGLNPASSTSDNVPDRGNNRGAGNSTRFWLTPAGSATGQRTEYYLNIVGGDSPSRPSETGGGLQNLPHFLENWQLNNSDPVESQFTTDIFGSFIQIGRSKYATAPYLATLNTSVFPRSASFGPQPADVVWDDDNDDNTVQAAELKPYFNSSIFQIPYGTSTTPGGYSTSISSGRTPFFGPPVRNWGSDPALLYQIPDLFAQKFTQKPAKINPDEFYREVGRDDAWVKGLLCAKVDGSNTEIIPRTSLPNNFCQGY